MSAYFRRAAAHGELARKYGRMGLKTALALASVSRAFRHATKAAEPRIFLEFLKPAERARLPTQVAALQWPASATL